MLTPSPSLTGGKSRNSNTAAVVLAIVVASILVFGAFGFRLPFSSPSSVKTVADGPTFEQVMAAVSSPVTDESGGPWALFSVYGIAAQTSFSPNLIGYAHTNLTVNSCGQAFNGLTLWNGTMPRFNGTFNSGTAPFWQLAYFSNDSQEILLTTDVMGQISLYPPIPYPSACMPWYDFPGDSAGWTSVGAIPVVDSSEAASAVWDAILEGRTTVGDWVSSNDPETEIITIGPGVFMGLGDAVSDYGVYFDRCGEAGVAGIQSLVLAGVGSTGQLIGTANLTHNCALIYSGEGAYDSEYDLLFSNSTVSSGPSTTLATIGFQVAIALPNGTLVNFYDEVGLANWMTSWNLTNPAGQILPLGTPTCGSWVGSVADCESNSSGWYAVVLSAGGEWMNTYGALPGGGVGWSEPVTALVSHQQLVIVYPSSWNVTGDRLDVTSTVPLSDVIGSTSL
jgi:hypothetical protein